MAEREINPQRLSRTIAVVDDGGKIIASMAILQKKDEDIDDFYKRLSAKLTCLEKKYSGMRIQESTCPNLGTMQYLFPELFRPKTS